MLPILMRFAYGVLRSASNVIRNSPFTVHRLPFLSFRRALPLLSALSLAFSLVWLLTTATRPAQAGAPTAQPQATAAVIRYVDKSVGDDSGDCTQPVVISGNKPCATIQRAIDVASAGDTIKVTQDTYTTLNTRGGGAQIVFIDKDVTVEGGYNSGFSGTPDPAGPTVIDPGSGGRGVVITGTATAALRVFRIDNGKADTGGLNGNGGGLLVGGSVVATLQNITIEDSTGSRGGGLYVQGGSLSGSSLILQRNTATENGGGAYAAGGSTTIVGGAIDQNQAVLGGGVYAAGGHFSLTGAPMRTNVASDRGGAVFAAGGTAVVGGGEVTANSAANGGGGGYATTGGAVHFAPGTILHANPIAAGEGQALYVIGGSAILTGTTVKEHTGNTHAIYVQDGFVRLAGGTTVRDNSVTTGDGGALVARGGWIEISGSSVVSNSAPLGNGGGLALITSTLVITDGTLGNNSAKLHGGAIHALTTTITATGGILNGNVAQVSGGALYILTGTVASTASSFALNSAQQHGGAIFGSDSGLVMDGGSVTDNRVTVGSGGGIFWNGVYITATNGLTFRGNLAGSDSFGWPPVTGRAAAITAPITQTDVLTSSGGGLFARGATMRLDSVIFDANRAGYLGGGLYVTATVDLITITNGLVTNNQANFGQGGGFFFSGITATITNTVFSGNRAANGAGLYLLGGRNAITGSSFTSNTATFNGGGLFATGGTASFAQDTWQQNVADRGAGLYARSVTGFITSSTFFANDAFNHGGGLFTSGGTWNLINGVLARNRVGLAAAKGGALYMQGGQMVMAHMTIANNEHRRLDGQGVNTGVYIAQSASRLAVYNSIIANHEEGMAGDRRVKVDGGANVWWNNTTRNWSPSLWSVEAYNIIGDPLFVNPAGLDYSIPRSSAAWGVGIPVSPTLPIVISTDIANERRVAVPDAGAYEHRYNRGLNIEQSAEPRILTPTMTLRYAITVGNYSRSALPPVSFNDVLPPEQTALGMSTDRGVCDPAALTCELGPFEIGDVAVIALDAQVTGQPLTGGILTMTNAANVTFDGIDPNDSDTQSLYETYLYDLLLDNTGVETYTEQCVVDLRGTLYTDVQAAVDASDRITDVVKVSGYCGGRVTLDKELKIQGGWSTTMKLWDPKLYTATLDATATGVVLSVSGQGIAPVVESITLRGGSGVKGGGVYINEASVVISDVKILGNSASSGAGMFLDFFSTPEIKKTIIEDNTASVAGGGVYMVESGAKFDNVIVRNNTGAVDGGGMFLLKSAAEIANSEVTTHTVTGFGGGIFLDESGAQIRLTRISDNSAGVGGGIYAIESPAALIYNRILSNTATSTPVLSGTVPLAPGGGGGVYAERSDAKAQGSVIEYNSAPAGTGAGVHFWDFRQPEISGNVVADNLGTGIYVQATADVTADPVAVRIRHNTISRNEGSGVLIDGQTNADLLNNIIWENTDGGVKFNGEMVSQTVTISYTFWGETGPDVVESGNISTTIEQGNDFSGENPAFVDPDAGEYHIKRISMAFQLGKNTDTATDMDAEKRNQGKFADIGADEYTFRQTRYASPTGGAEEECINWKKPCSLQAALDAATEGDLIKLDAGVYSTITERNGHRTVGYVEKTVTIQGGYCSTDVPGGVPISGIVDCDWEHPFPEKYPAIINPGGQGRGLTIVGKVSPEIFEIHLTGGDPSSGSGPSAGWGGGLYVLTSTAIISRVQIYANNAISGGGLFLQGSEALLWDSSVTTNTATDGGGIYLFQKAAATILSDTIRANSAGYGAGFYIHSSDAKVISNAIQSNVAITGGGGFYLADSAVKVEENTVVSNTAAAGGAFYLAPGKPNVVSNTVHYNAAANGGAFYLKGSEGLVATNVISANAATATGGAFYANDTKTTVNFNRVFSNTAPYGGGFHLFIASKIVVQDNHLYSNTATLAGGAFSLDASSPVIERNYITANVAITGGGVYLSNFSGASLTQNWIISNTATDSGGGIYLKQSDALLDQLTIISNTARLGGGFYSKLGSATFKRSTVISNTAGFRGGGVYLDETAATVQESTIYSNSAAADGGGVFVLRSSEAKLENLDIRHNVALSSGGGVAIFDSNLVLKANRVISNSAALHGGGLYLDKSVVGQSVSLVAGNAAAAGAGMYVTNGSNGEFFASALIDNLSAGPGGALVIEGSSPTFWQTTIARNGGNEAVLIEKLGQRTSTAKFVNTIFAEQPVAIQITAQNSGTLDGTLWHRVDTQISDPALMYTGTVTLLDDPRFEADGYHISKFSPAVNRGVDSRAESDIDEDVVPQDGTPDIGADEFPVECAARLESNPGIIYADIQSAVDAAGDGEFIRLAGTCKGVSNRNGRIQTVYLDKTVHLRGGFAQSDWTVSYPLTQPTTITSKGQGRVFYITGSGQPVIESVVIQDGNASALGGGPDGQDAGGNLFIDGASAVFSDTQMVAGGAIYGGAVFMQDSSAQIITSTLRANKASTGGAIFALRSGAVISDSVFDGNGATGDGGGIFLSRSPARIEASVFKKNEAKTAGGAIFLDGSDAVIVGNSYTENKAESAAGVYLDSSPARVEFNLFQKNEAQNAGGLMASRSPATINGNRFILNQGLNGGGVYLEFSDARVTNNLLISNTATSSGSGLFVQASDLIFYHNTLVYNTGGDGSAFYVNNIGPDNSAIDFKNNILAHLATAVLVRPGNSVNADGNFWFANGTDVEALGSFTEGSTRFTDDPRFADPAGLNFGLTSQSPAINVALTTDVDADFEKDPRPTDSASDVGADEFFAPDMSLVSSVAPNPPLAGSEASFTFQVVNLGNVPLNSAITATVSADPLGTVTRNWPGVGIAVGDSWVDVMTVTVPVGYAGPLVYAFHVGTEEGIRGALTQTVDSVLPEAAVQIVQQRQPEQVILFQPYQYNISVRNVGNRSLTLTITDTLPVQTEPTGEIVWNDVEIPTGGTWTQSVTVRPIDASNPTLINRISVSGAEGFRASSEDSTTIGQPAVSLAQSISPTEIYMGAPFSLTVVAGNSGNIPLPATITITIDPPLYGDPTRFEPTIASGGQVTFVVPYPPNSYLGPISINTVLTTAVGVGAVDTLQTEAVVRPIRPVIVAQQDGFWNDPNTWEPGRVPLPDDVVLIDTATVTTETPISIDSLDNRGTLVCAPGTGLTMNATSEIQNYGTIVCADGADGATPGASGLAGGSVELTTPTFHNEGTVQGGKGGNGTDGQAPITAGGLGGPGGNLIFHVALLSNVGPLRSGDGGNGGIGVPECGDGGAGGSGGQIVVDLTSPTGSFYNEGPMLGGNGGRGADAAQSCTTGGEGGEGGSGGQGGPIELQMPEGGPGDEVEIVNTDVISGGLGGDAGRGGPGGPNQPNPGGDGGNGGGGGQVTLTDDGDGPARTVLDNPGVVNGGGGGNGGPAGPAGPGGTGGTGGDAGDGGPVTLLGDDLFNDGEINGGDAGLPGPDGPGSPGGNGGNGGDVTLVGSQSGPGVVDSPGTITGGDASPPPGSEGGDVTIIASPDLFLDGGTVRGGNGPNRGDIFIGTGETTTGLEPFISLSGPGTLLVGGDLTISGGTLTTVFLEALDPNAISLDGVFFLAVGPGGTLSLVDNDGLVVVAGQFLAFADNVSLLPGVTLDALSSGPVTVQGSFFYYGAQLFLPAQVTGRPGGLVRIPALLVNLGPLADSYRLEAGFGPARSGWSVAPLPDITPVAGNGARLVHVTATIPLNAAIGSRQPLTLTATSYTDGSVRPVARVVILVREGGQRFYLPFISFLGLDPAQGARIQFLPLVGGVGAVEAAESGTQEESAPEESVPEESVPEEPVSAPEDEPPAQRWNLWLPLVRE